MAALTLPNLASEDSMFFGEWSERTSDIRALIAPILDSAAFQRLGGITFLGALSPRILNLSVTQRCPPPKYRTYQLDGSRRSHSLGVALLIIDIARSLRMSVETQRHAAAWGLLHDIGNWPLSHTGEFAFARITSTTTKDLRRTLITGSDSVPSELSLIRPIKESGLNQEWVLDLLEHRSANLPSELRHLDELLKSPLTPDAIEGMWRCGCVFGVPVPPPADLAKSFIYNLFTDITLSKEFGRAALSFWRAKSAIYRKYINGPAAVRWESAWGRAILRAYPTISLRESLSLTESQVVERVQTVGLEAHPPLSKYKAPLEYFLDPPRARSVREAVALQHLSRIFASRQMRSDNLGGN